ncbi:MAG: ArsA-related P-loop ATPase [Polyangiales bacterium]
MSLAEVIRTHRVVVTVGSGGVGKTTTAAALAMRAAMEGRKVLCLTIDPARRLANSLGLEAMTRSQQEVPSTLFERHGLELRGQLYAMMLDTKSTFDDLVKKYASSDEVRNRILNNEIYQYVAKSLAGTQEYMAMEKLFEVRRDEHWDLIVLDTPPTANALDFLDAPERLIDAIDSPAMRWFMQVFEGAGKAGFGLVGKGATVLLKGLARFTGVEFLQQVSEFVGGINDLFGGFKARAEEVSNALRSDDVGFVLVTSPDPLAVQEAEFFAKKLDESGMVRRGIVINRMHPLLAECSVAVEEQERLLKELVPNKPNITSLRERLQTALDAERDLAGSDRVEAERLKTHLAKGGLVIEVPAFDTDVHDLRTLAEVANYLTTG